MYARVSVQQVGGRGRRLTAPISNETAKMKCVIELVRVFIHKAFTACKSKPSDSKSAARMIHQLVAFVSPETFNECRPPVLTFIKLADRACASPSADKYVHAGPYRIERPAGFPCAAQPQSVNRTRRSWRPTAVHANTPLPRPRAPLKLSSEWPALPVRFT